MTEHEKTVRDVVAFFKTGHIVVYNERIAVIRDEMDEITKGGIYIPEEAKRKEPRGTVVAIGLGVEMKDDDTAIAGCRIGDQIMYTKYNPILFRITLPTGEDVNLELMHISDLYIGAK